MNDTISITREGAVFRIHIDMPLENEKAKDIAVLIESDAGEATVDVSGRRRLRQMTACGIVTPMTMREIVKVLAR